MMRFSSKGTMQADRTEELSALLERRILILDGAMGTTIQGYRLSEADFRGERFAASPRDLRGNNDLLTLTRPGVIREIHSKYLEARADIIETNTFNSNAPSQPDYGLERLVYELNHAAAALAREAADRSMERHPGTPRILARQTPEAFWNSLRRAWPIAVGLNCALGAKLMRPYIEELSKVADSFISCYPNPGLPNPLSETGYDETPEYTSGLLREFGESGFLNIVGGCCGTTPDHIRAIARAVRELPPRKPPAPQKKLRLSGLEALNISDESLFVNVGERTNVSGSRAFARMILAGDYQEGLAVARQQVDNGAHAIDVNMDESMLH